MSARTLSITAALAVMIPLSAYAATTSGTSSDGTGKVDKSAVSDVRGDYRGHGPRGGFEGKGEVLSDEVLSLLKLDQAEVAEKLKAGSSLAEIAEQQGVSRDSLKAAMTEAFNKQLERMKSEYAANLDKLVDSDLQAFHEKMRLGGKLDLTAVGKVLGLSADELKSSLSDGKSLADVAKEKGVDAQKVIDAVTSSLTSEINQAVKDGKLTQEEADKRLANVADEAQKLVNGERFGPGGHRGGPGGPGGHGGDSEASAAAAALQSRRRRRRRLRHRHRHRRSRIEKACSSFPRFAGLGQAFLLLRSHRPLQRRNVGRVCCKGLTGRYSDGMTEVRAVKVSQAATATDCRKECAVKVSQVATATE